MDASRVKIKRSSCTRFKAFVVKQRAFHPSLLQSCQLYELSLALLYQLFVCRTEGLVKFLHGFCHGGCCIWIFGEYRVLSDSCKGSHEVCVMSHFTEGRSWNKKFISVNVSIQILKILLEIGLLFVLFLISEISLRYHRRFVYTGWLHRWAYAIVRKRNGICLVFCCKFPTNAQVGSEMVMLGI